MDYYELCEKTGMEITRDQYDDIENVYISTSKFNDVADVVSFFKTHGFEKAYERIMIMNYRAIKMTCKNLERKIGELRGELNRACADRDFYHTQVKNLKNSLNNSCKEPREVTKAKDDEIANLTRLLDAYRQIVDISKLDKDAIVMALARQ